MWASGIEIRHIKQSFIYTACLKVMVAHHLDVPLVSNLVSSFENSATVRKNWMRHNEQDPQLILAQKRVHENIKCFMPNRELLFAIYLP